MPGVPQLHTVTGMEGAHADAIREAEASLVRQRSVTAQVDLQVVTAVLNAHAAHDRATEALTRLQQDVETAVTSRPDLGTPAGARSFQGYLVGKLRDIRTVVDEADLDASSRATLLAALSALYASSETTDAPAGGLIPSDLMDPGPLDPSDPTRVDPPAPVQSAAPAPAPAPAGGWPGMPAPSSSDLNGPDLSPLTDRIRHHTQPEPDQPAADATKADEPAPTPDTGAPAAPDLTDVISDAVAGTPIAEAFSRHGITIPEPGSVVTEPVDPALLSAGDVGVFADRHALALGNGKALLDNQIQPVTAVGGPGFLGWQHPPKA